MHALGSEPGGVPLGTDALWEFCLGGLVGGAASGTSTTKPSRRKR
jgi:hypothetical protein